MEITVELSLIIDSHVYSNQAGTHAVFVAVVMYALLLGGQHRKIPATQSRIPTRNTHSLFSTKAAIAWYKPHGQITIECLYYHSRALLSPTGNTNLSMWVVHWCNTERNRNTQFMRQNYPQGLVGKDVINCFQLCHASQLIDRL